MFSVIYNFISITVGSIVYSLSRHYLASGYSIDIIDYLNNLYQLMIKMFDRYIRQRQGLESQFFVIFFFFLQIDKIDK